MICKIRNIRYSCYMSRYTGKFIESSITLKLIDILLQHLLHKNFIVIKHCQFVGSGKLFCFFVVGFFFFLHII